MGLAHAAVDVEEERVVSLGGPLGDSLGRGHGELVAASNDEGVELVAGVQLRGGAPVKPRLLGHWAGDCSLHLVARASLAGRALAMAGHGCEAAVFAHLGRGRVLLRSGEWDRFDVEAEGVDRLTD